MCLSSIIIESITCSAVSASVSCACASSFGFLTDSENRLRVSSKRALAVALFPRSHRFLTASDGFFISRDAAIRFTAVVFTSYFSRKAYTFSGTETAWLNCLSCSVTYCSDSALSSSASYTACLSCSGVISSQLSSCTNSIFSGESVSSTSLRQFVWYALSICSSILAPLLTPSTPAKVSSTL